MTFKVPPRFMTTILLQGKSYQDSDKLANIASPRVTQGPSALLSGVVGLTIPVLSTILNIQMVRLESIVITENIQ